MLDSSRKRPETRNLLRFYNFVHTKGSGPKNYLASGIANSISNYISIQINSSFKLIHSYAKLTSVFISEGDTNHLQLGLSANKSKF